MTAPTIEPKRENRRALLAILALTFIARIGFTLFAVDIERDYYWEFGEIGKNILSGRGYSFWYFEGAELEFHHTPDSRPLPSAYMPPGYVGFILPFLLIDDVALRNLLILGVQALASTLLAFLLYRFTERYFDRRAAPIAALIFALTPELIYASSSYGPTTFYQLGVMALLFLLYRSDDEARPPKPIPLALLIASLVYLRSEFLLFGLLVLALIARRGSMRTALASGALVVALLAPWSIRNSLLFDSFVPLTTSVGLNFYRGHNPYHIGAWGDDTITTELRTHGASPHYELEMNRIMLREGIETIGEQPARELGRTFVKLFRFWVIDSSDERTHTPIYYLPWFATLLLAVVGSIATASWKRHRYSYLFFIYSSVIVMIFLALPRYQTMMKTALIPFAAYGVVMIVRRKS